MRKIAGFCLVGFVSLGLVIGVYARLWGKGIPITHDGPIHVVRMAGYYLALQQGQLPPRWGPNLANGLGYPVFNYNYPLANIVAIGFIRLHISYPTAYQLTLFSFMLLGIMGTAFWLQRFTRNRFYLFLGMVLYITNPFLITQVFVRGGVGEIAFIGLLPWVFWSISAVLGDKTPLIRKQVLLGFLGGLLALTHNVLAVFSLPILFGYSLWESKHIWKRLLRLFIPIIIAFLLSAFFWIPALMEKNLIVLDDVPITQDFAQHFLWPHQLVSGSWSYGFSRPGPVDGLSFRLSLVELLLIGIISGWHFLPVSRTSKSSLVLWILILIELLLTTNVTQRFWFFIPFRNYIQFPWRLLWFGHVSLLAYFVWWFSRVGVSRKFTLFTITLCLIEAFIFAHPQARANRTTEEWLRAGETTSTMNENAPKTFQLDLAYQIKEQVFGDKLVWTSTPSAEISIKTWDGTKRTYEVNTAAPLTIVERTAYFPGWETTVDGAKIVTSSQDPWKAGLITYSIPAGSHLINTTFTQHTLARQIGNTLSIIGLVVVGGGWLWTRRK